MSYWSRNSFRVAVPGQDSHWYMINLSLSVLQTIFLIRSLYVKSQIIALTSNATFWWALQTQIESVVFESARIHHLGLKAQNFENPIFIFGCFPFKVVYNSWKLRRLLRDAKFLFMYSFTHTNILSLSKSSKFLVLQFLLICCKLNSVFKFLSKSHISF